jgi:hypothetical protein
MMALAAGTLPGQTMATDLRPIVPVVKRSVVGIITNAHVVSATPTDGKMVQLGIVLPDGEGIRFRPAELVARDNEHDLAHLRLSGPPLPALELGDSDTVQEGQELALTGFPLAMALGLHAATHRATLAAITPIVRPSLGARNLDPRQITALQRAPFNIFQDGVPGQQRQPRLRSCHRQGTRRDQCRICQGIERDGDLGAKRDHVCDPGEPCPGSVAEKMSRKAACTS